MFRFICLDGYLDQVTDSETYKKKKNELFEEKFKIVEYNQGFASLAARRAEQAYAGFRRIPKSGPEKTRTSDLFDVNEAL